MFAFHAVRARPSLGRWCRPRLEQLEERLVPSLIPDGWIVETTSPSGFVYPDQWSSLASFPTGVFAVNPSTGEQSLVAARAGGLFSRPEALTVANGKLYVADARAFGPGGGGIIAVDPLDGKHNLIAPPGHIHRPTSLAVVNGAIYVASGSNASRPALP